MSFCKRIIDEISWFDFTQESPKVVMVFTGDNIVNKFDCIALYILNIIGFDVAVFTPSGYIGLEKVLDESLFESYNLGEPNFNFTYRRVDRFTSKKGLFGRLFG